MDPKASIEAILEKGPHAFTLARWALLEKIDSPLAVKGGKGSILETLFVMYAPSETLRRIGYRCEEIGIAAMEWADQIPAGEVQDMLDKAMDKVQIALYMCQEPASKKKATLQMDS